jgi:hypothetical protein
MYLNLGKIILFQVVEAHGIKQDVRPNAIRKCFEPVFRRIGWSHRRGIGIAYSPARRHRREAFNRDCAHVFAPKKMKPRKNEKAGR